MKVIRQGDQLAVILSEDVINALNISEGDDIELSVNDTSGLTLTPATGNEQWLENLPSFTNLNPGGFDYFRANPHDESKA
ncbi:MAG: hypothetical protein QM645_13915 [Asticcacaulis sp.]